MSEKNKDTDAITMATYNKIAPNYCPKTRQDKYLKWEDEYISKLMKYTDTSSPEILDVGCGDGRHCLLIDKNGGHAMGIDFSEGMILESQKYYPEGEFKQMDMRVLEFDDNSFHGIWSSGSIYHVSKLEVKKVMAEFKRVLKPNGIVAVNFKLGQGESLEANPKSYGGSPRYFAYYTKSEMVDLFENFGFEEIESVLYPEEIFGADLQQMWFRLKI